MNFKLLRDHDHYMLINSFTRELFATTDESIAKVSNKYLLKKTNCMEIFEHVDVRDLGSQYAWQYSQGKGMAKHNIAKESFIDGYDACYFLEDYKFKSSDMIEFAKWLNSLTPSEKVSVWSKNGEHKGLFNMDEEQLFEKWLRKKNEIYVEFDIDVEAPCPHCGEEENIHTNYEYSERDRPIEEFLCNECGKYFVVPKLISNFVILRKKVL